jgi:hypothetical protein
MVATPKRSNTEPRIEVVRPIVYTVEAEIVS